MKHAAGFLSSNRLSFFFISFLSIFLAVDLGILPFALGRCINDQDNYLQASMLMISSLPDHGGNE